MNGNEPEGIVVVGVGVGEVQPDRVRAHVGISTVARSIRDALSAAATAQDAVVRAALDAGMAREALQTAGYQVGPDHQQYADPSQYRADVTLTVIVDDLSAAGQLLGAMADAAGDAFRVHAVRPESSDLEPAWSVARRAAVAAARRQAEELAEAAGVTLGPLQSLVENPGGRAMPGARAVMLTSSSGAAPDIEAGVSTVQLSVTATYDITH